MRALRSSKTVMARRTPLNYEESLLRLHSYLEREGVLKALRKEGVQHGDMVRIGDYELEWQDEG